MKKAFSVGLLLFLLLCWGACGRKPPILIGFAGELTNRRGPAGLDARDGAQLAVDVINAEGGVRGRSITLIVKDDQRDPTVARRVDAALTAEGVVAIIGHLSSEQTAAALDFANEAGIVLLSPVSASSVFSGQRDYFFRVVPDNALLGYALAVHLYQNRDLSHLTFIYDLSNQAFTESLWGVVHHEFTRLGGIVDETFPFMHGDTDLKALMARVKLTNPEALVMIAAPRDTALMAQYGRQLGVEVPLFGSSWAQSQDLLEEGGRAVEGLELVAGFHPENPYPAFQPFVERFEARYGRSPTFSAAFAYEAVLVLARALEQTRGRAEGLPEALTAIEALDGIQGVISINEYGDVERDVYIVQVNQGSFRVIHTLSPD